LLIVQQKRHSYTKQTMKKPSAIPTAVIVILAAGLCLGPTAKAADETPSAMHKKSNLSMNDKKFVQKAYRGGREEVEDTKIAKEKAKDPMTQDVADRMIADHTKANEKLEAIATEEHLDLSHIHPKSMAISGSNFDHQYLTMLEKDHEKDIAMFEKEANDVKPGEDRDVPAFAKDTLPILTEHLQMIKAALAKEK
jgi:putative membrane protein